MSRHVQDWHPLARLTDATEAEVGFSPDPVMDIIQLWSSKSNHNANVSELVAYLQVMEIWDKIKDVSWWHHALVRSLSQ